jgi:hypothetical protein
VKKINQKNILVFLVFVVTTGFIFCGGNFSNVFGKEKQTPFVQKSTPTSSLMRIINSNSAKILEAIMIGDFDTVIKKSNEVAKAGSVIMRMFFPEGEKVEEWFKNAGKDPNDPEAVKAMKAEFEKFSKVVVESSKNIAEVAKNNNIAETYESFEAMMKNACFACHAVSRAKK